MSNESIAMIKTNTEKLRIKKRQLLALQKKETEGNEKAAMLEKSLAQAKKDHEACLLSNLAGNTSDKALDQSKATIKKLMDSIHEANEISEPMQMKSPNRCKKSNMTYSLKFMIWREI